MLESGYRLQMPFYALAAVQAFQAEVAAVQFVSLSKGGGRGRGIFFPRHNGKVPDALTQLRSNAASLIAEEPAEVWSRFGDHIVRVARRYLGGEYRAVPGEDVDCRNCQSYSLCGISRRTEAEVE